MSHLRCTRRDATTRRQPKSRRSELYHPKTFIGKYIWSQDAKVIAIQYAITAIGIGLVALVLSWLMRLQLGFPHRFAFIDPRNYLQFVTMHGMIMVVYLLTALFLGGFGNYLIPLMVGARDMVFPYVNMLSYWVYLFAVLLLVASFFVPGGPTGAGWTLYPPQAILDGTPGATWGIILMLVSLAFFIIGFTMGGLNYVVTVLQARTRGMTLMRLPLTVWGIFMATILALLAFPALFVSAIMMLLDLSLGTSFFMPALVSTGQQLELQRRQPAAVPAPVLVLRPSRGLHRRAAGVRHRLRPDQHACAQEHLRLPDDGLGDPGHRRAVSFVVWAHHMYVSGMNPYFGFFFATTTLIIAIPTAIKVYNWVLTLWRGNIHLTVPMLFAIGFIFTFINGGLTGLFLGNVDVDLPLSDTMFVVAHFHMVMAIAPILVVFGAIYHWYPKVTGRMLDDTAGQDPLLDHLRRHLRDLLPDALPRVHGRAAPLLRDRRHGLHPANRRSAERGDHGRRAGRRRGAAAVPLQPGLELLQGPAVGPQSLARDDAGMADARDAAEARQLRQGAAGGLPLGLRLQRAGRQAGLHPAERAAERASRPAPLAQERSSRGGECVRRSR